MSPVPFGFPGTRPGARAAVLRAIARLGFRRWYERKLIEGHAWLAACFLSMIIVAAGVELLVGRASTAESLLDVSVIAVGTALGWLSWRRYAAIMRLAGLLGDQAVCPGCGRFGFRCEPLQSAGKTLLDVGCPRCERRWQVGGGIDEQA